MARVYLFVPFLLACAMIFAVVDKSSSHSSSPTPTHVAAVFFDGVNHGDYRQSCSVWEAARSKMGKCESGLTVQMATSAYEGIFGGYKVVARSVKEWRTGAVEYATVAVVYLPYGGQKLVAHLRKRPGGQWEIWWIG